MEKIKLHTLYLDDYKSCYDSLKYEFKNDSKSRFIHSIVERLENSSLLSEFAFQKAYVVLDNEPVGYVYISDNIKDEVFIEVSVLKSKRGMGYGTKIINEVSNYLFQKHNIKCVKLDIDPSNKNSMSMAENCYFEFDYDEYAKRNYIGHMIFYKESDCYVNKRNSRR